MAEVVDQADARYIDLVELEAGAGIIGDHPAALDPGGQLHLREAGKQGRHRRDVHHPVSMSARGSVGWRGFQVFRNSASSGSSAGGSTGTSSTNWCPLPSIPRPRSRSRVPRPELGGIVRRTGALMVGTSNVVPSTASCCVTGSSTMMSSPSRRNIGC